MSPKEFAKKVVNQMTNRQGVFANRLNVEDWVPEHLNHRDKALFLFYLTQLDYATKSTRLYEGARKLLKKQHQFFCPEHILIIYNYELKEAMTDYLKPRYINEAMRRYRENSQKLVKEYKSDPHYIFEAGDAVESLKRIWEFRGFGPKTGNLFFRSMVVTFNLDLKNIDKVLPPVDIHDVRIAKLMGFIDSDEMTDRNIKTVKNLWSKACKDADVNWMVFDKALWLLGSIAKPKSKEDLLQQL